MNQTLKKKFALLLSLALLFGTMAEGFVGGTVTKAATTKDVAVKAATETKYQDDHFYLSVEKLKAGAKYSISISNKKVVKLVRTSATWDKNELCYTLKGMKVGKSTVTVKRTYKGKTKKILTKTLVVKKYVNTGSYSYLSPNGSLPKVDKNDNSYNPVRLLKVEVGSKVPMATVANYYGGTPGITFNTNGIFTKSGNTLTAAKIGTTTATVSMNTSYNGHVEIAVKMQVIAKRNSATAKLERSVTSRCKSMLSKKITSKNCVSLLNSLQTLKKDAEKVSKLNRYMLYDSDNVLKTPEGNKIYDLQEKFYNYFAPKGNNTSVLGGVSLEVLSISKVTSSKVTLKLKKKVSKYDVMAYLSSYASYSKYSSKAKMKYNFVINGQYYNAEVKTGAQKITLKRTWPKLKNQLKKGKTYTVLTVGKSGAARGISVKVK